MRILSPLLLIVACVVFGIQAPDSFVAWVVAPALLLVPGWGFARARSGDLVRRVFEAVGFSVLISVATVTVARWLGLGGAGVLAGTITLTALGWTRPASPAAPLAPEVRRALGFGLALLVVLGLTEWRALLRPLDGYWFDSAIEAGWEEGAAQAPSIGTGWEYATPIGWEEAGAMRLIPKNGHPVLEGPSDAPLYVAIRGPVGAGIRIAGQEQFIAASVTENEEEGPVARYLNSGVAALRIDKPLDKGERFGIALTHPQETIVYLIPRPDAVWSLHAAGELRFVHYYQLLNMVEQFQWAEELLLDRWVTDVQPPLGSYPMAAAHAVITGDMPTANALMLLALIATVMAGFLYLRAFAPDAPALAWLLPPMAALVHARLMLEPGNAMMPDSWYALALVAALGALAEPGGRYAGFSLAAQLLRYPGMVVAGIGAVLDGQFRRAAGMVALVLAAAAGFGLIGLATGEIEQWLETVHWETGPEHYQEEDSLGTAIARIPAFFLLWLQYGGGTPALAALRWPRGTRIALGTAVTYGLILGTIDHSPTHYFLPLLHLGALACGTTAAACRAPALRLGLPLVGLLGMGAFYLWGNVV